MYLSPFLSSIYFWFYFLMSFLMTLDRCLTIVYQFSIFLFLFCAFPANIILHIDLYSSHKLSYYIALIYTVQNIFNLFYDISLTHVIFRIHYLISENLGNFLVTSFWMISDINALGWDNTVYMFQIHLKDIVKYEAHIKKYMT